MAAVPYFDLVRDLKNAYNFRLQLVQQARQHGIKPAARAFETTVPTVRKWLRRFQQHGLSGLREHSRAHHHCPHKTPSDIEQQVLALRRKLPTFGAARPSLAAPTLPVSSRLPGLLPHRRRGLRCP